jgi:uncharacterized protein
MLACLCCGTHSLAERGKYELCDACGWEDDPVQSAQPDHPGGANAASLTEFRARFQRERLERIVRADAHLMRILRVARESNLPDWRLVAGCIYQTVWNVLTSRPQGTGINDYDLIYFDGSDYSVEAEQVLERRVRDALPGLPAPLEVRNQARVHLWFEDYFGIPYQPLTSSNEAITRYASATHCVGLRLMPDDSLDLFAPFGLNDIFSLVVRPNPVLPNKPTHDRKAARVKAIWPELTIIPWAT